MKKIAALLFVFTLACCVMAGKRKETLEGELIGHPLSAPVKIVYDKIGIPHVMAQTDQDLFYGLGYAMAQDRFFYMDIARKAGRGEFGRLFGRLPHYKSYDLLNADRLLRSFQYDKRAREGVAEMDPASLALMQSFTAGVNRYLNDARGKMPEYRALGISPDPWRVEDSLVAMDLYGLSMTLYSFFYEYYAGRITREHGPETAALFIPEYPKDATYVNEDWLPGEAHDHALESMFGTLEPLLPVMGAIGSNNWVIDGDISASTMPILSNDPHVPHPTAPTFWYNVHLAGGSFNAAGMMFPAVPLLGAGSNGMISWGITNARCDYIDVFVEKLNPRNPNQYLHDGVWREFEKITETIPVKNYPDQTHVHRRSVHGALIEPAMTGYQVPELGDKVLAIHLIDVDFPRHFAGYLNIPRARNKDELKLAVSDMAMGPVAWNTVWADAEGNIGYLYSGHVPERPDNQGLLPRPGTGEFDYAGWVDFDSLPHLTNPEKHFIVTANNKIEGPDYPIYLSSGYNIPSRAQRITDMLTGRTGLTVEDMLKIQMDTKLQSADRFASLMVEDLRGSGDPRLEAMADLMRTWMENGARADLASLGAGPYQLIQKEMGKLAFQDDISNTLLTNMGMASMITPALWKIMEDRDSKWFDNRETPRRETRVEITREAALIVHDYLSQKYGHSVENWKWGNLQRFAVRHPLGFLPWNRKHRVGTFPLAGCHECVNNADGLFIEQFGYLVFAGPSTRISVDMADPYVIYINASAGNSENPDSPLFKNLTADWLAGQYAVLSMKPEVFIKDKIGELILSPAAEK